MQRYTDYKRMYDLTFNRESILRTVALELEKTSFRTTIASRLRSNPGPWNAIL